MSSVTFPAVAGGATYTDDSDPSTGLANGGHKTRFIPALKAVVDTAADVTAKSISAANSAAAAEVSAAYINGVAGGGTAAPLLLTGYASAAGIVAETDTVLQAINKLNGNDALKQDNLVSGTNIKTIFGNSMLGSGNVTFQAGIAATAISANTTAVKDNRYVCDTTAGVFNLTLPIAPVAGDYIEVVDAKGTWGTNNLTVVRNGSVINGSATDLVMDISNVFVTLTYSGNATRGWQVDVGGSDFAVTPLDNSVSTQKVVNKAITMEKIAFESGSLSNRNVIINGNFNINQRAYVSGAAVGAGLYAHDRWKMAASGDIYTFSFTANVTTITIPSAKVLRQVVEGLNLQSGTYVLSWVGTAQGKIGAGSYGTSGITGLIVGGTDTTIEFSAGTVSKVQLELGTVATPFEFRPYGAELALCQRYYELGSFRAPIAKIDYMGGSTQFSVVKRNTPAVTFADFVGNASRFSSGTTNNLTISAGGLAGSVNSLFLDALPTVTLVLASNWLAFTWAASAEL